jgi:hypothetical protein
MMRRIATTKLPRSNLGAMRQIGESTMPNIELIERLQVHYREVDTRGWGYDQCVAGVLRDWEVIPTMECNVVASALGVSFGSAYEAIYGGSGNVLIRFDLPVRRDVIVEMLEGLKTDAPRWRGQPPIDAEAIERLRNQV